MGKAFSHRRPEDKPMYVKPNQLDYEKRALLVTSISTTLKSVIHTIIDDRTDENGWIWDGGSASIAVTDSVVLIYDLGGAS